MWLNSVAPAARMNQRPIGSGEASQATSFCGFCKAEVGLTWTRGPPASKHWSRRNYSYNTRMLALSTAQYTGCSAFSTVTSQEQQAPIAWQKAKGCSEV
jgi:hypothetical protein